METVPDIPEIEPLAPEVCAACEETRTGEYCGACGHRRQRPEDESLRHFFAESTREVTSADGRLWRTLRALFVPGKLTAEYFSGRRNVYARPVRVFLVINVLLFFLLGFLQQNPLVGELEMQRQSLGAWAASSSDARLAEWGGSREVFELVFDGRSRTLASSLIGLLIPMFALQFALSFGVRRGARHLVFATHVIAALIAGYMLLTGFLLGVFTLIAGTGRIGGAVTDWVLVGLILSLTATFIAHGARRVYDVDLWRAWIGSGLIATVGLAASIMLYRIVLFWLTLWTLRLPPAA